ncbi:class I SAM-dependent methyltransferase [Streptomyces panaciradicis]|uniref:class I SAM-dependent methyltransferase n=1 Tax=Streptomyces panaciradicis TaxID=1470261 RepID=UPI00201CF623|nr:class I SAM-dependent methyltransferase [Streptomyces panaciradicis]MCL6669930.1 class I SAM-dependent methyltransferase [Streptomyces panaciradicis]
MTSSAGDFYDSLAPDYHRIFPDWEASIARQAAVLDGLLRSELGPGPHRLLDCACGIGTQAIGLARAGHRVVGSDLSPVAAARAAAEAAARGVELPVTAADMRRLPFRPGAFDAVVCADNSIAHLMSCEDTAVALGEMRRTLRDDGLLLLTLRDYDALRRTRPASTPPQVSYGPDGRTITFQLWHWHEDGEHYDQEYFQLLPQGEGWEVRLRRAASRALSREQLVEAASAAGFDGLDWHSPEATGFHQPVLTARAAG